MDSASILLLPSLVMGEKAYGGVGPYFVMWAGCLIA